MDVLPLEAASEGFVKGRPSVPSHLRVITGNPGKRAIEPGPTIDPAIPDMPQHLNARARAEWDRIVPELVKAGLLAVTDRAILAMYCVAFARWVEAEEKIAELAKADADGGLGLVRKAHNGFEQMTMWTVVSNKAQEQVLKYASEFGLSPATRARVAALAKQGALFGDDPLEAVLNASSRLPSRA